MGIKSSASVTTEETPLLFGTSGTEEEEFIAILHEHHGDSDDAELATPWSQIYILCFVRMVEPVAFFSIFPFLNKMIAEMGVEEVDVGFYSGWIVSCALLEPDSMNRDM